MTVKNDLFYAGDGTHITATTADKEIQRNIKRSTTKQTWRMVGHREQATAVYLIPITGRRKAERIFGVTTRKLE